MFCKMKDVLVLEILNNSFEADVLKSIVRPVPISSQAYRRNGSITKNLKKKQTNIFFSFFFLNISFGCMSESTMRVIYSTYERLNVVVDFLTVPKAPQGYVFIHPFNPSVCHFKLRGPVAC